MAAKKSEKEEKEERCEECDTEADDALVNVILNGTVARLCRRCARINQAIIIEKPTSEQLATAERLSITRMTERIARIPGLAEELRKIPSAPNEVTVGDLRELQEKKREKDKETEKKKEIQH